MATYTKISELSAASALGGTEAVEVVQSGGNVKATPSQIADYVAAASAMTAAFQPIADGVTNTVQVVKEYLFTEDNELDYSASLTDGMPAATVTFSELPANTVAIWVYAWVADAGTSPDIKWRRTSGGTLGLEWEYSFADGGTNVSQGTMWMPTGGNSIYVTDVQADSSVGFVLLGYKTSE